MQSLMVVVVHVLADVLTECGHGRKDAAMNTFGFEGVKERFDVGVFIRGAAPRHALANPPRGEEALQRLSLEFTAAVAVKDQPGRGPTSTVRRLHESTHEAGRPGARQPPGQHPSRILIENEG